jgi:hypothetical protein
MRSAPLAMGGAPSNRWRASRAAVALGRELTWSAYAGKRVPCSAELISTAYQSWNSIFLSQ